MTRRRGYSEATARPQRGYSEATARAWRGAAKAAGQRQARVWRGIGRTHSVQLVAKIDVCTVVQQTDKHLRTANLCGTVERRLPEVSADAVLKGWSQSLSEAAFLTEPCLLVAFTSALWFASRSTQLVCPFMAARWMGVCRTLEEQKGDSRCTLWCMLPTL